MCNIENTDKSLYEWLYLDVNDLQQIDDAINDIYDRKYHGLIIRNVFSQEECGKMVNNIDLIDRNSMIQTTGGHSYPRIFAQVVRPLDKSEVTEQTLIDYFNECETLPNHLKQILGIDVSERIESIFAKISGGRPITIPKGLNGNGSYANTTIRVNYANQGYISVHCGNYFQQEFPDFYTHLKQEVNIKDQLSYFITAQAADEGGELTLYDLLWEDGQTKENAHVDNEIHLSNGDKLDVSSSSNFRRMHVKPNDGDLLIFLGGPIWHRVEKVKGLNSRITIGGFLAFSHDHSEIKYWS